MKIALLMAAKGRPSVITASTMARLAKLGRVVVNMTDKTDDETIKDLIHQADIAVTSWGNGPLSGKILDCAPGLRLVAHAAGSIKPIASAELFARQIPVISSAAVLSRGVSETALGFTIAAAKNFFALNDLIHTGGWQHDRQSITELFEINIGVVGCGHAGAHYIELLQQFDVDVLAYDPHLPASRIAALGARKVELDELLQKSDIISLHAPDIPATRHMINQASLALTKDDLILINTARGSLIDEKALYEHMKTGRIKYACLDVTDPEPPAADNPLRSLPNCIMTPHLAGLANNGLGRIGRHVAAEVERLLKGEKLISRVTADMLATMA